MNFNKPTLVLDEEKCRRNIRKMAKKAIFSNVIFRPHFKTHQSATIGEWFREEGIKKITVSSVTMADFFAKHGWSDITIAFPFNLRELNNAKKIAAQIKLNILTSSLEHLITIKEMIDFRSSCYIKIDTGYKRAGVEWNDSEQILRMISILDKNDHLRMEGFLVHAGHSYQSRTKYEIKEIYFDTLKKCNSLKENSGKKEAIISTGDTPTCSIVDDFIGIDEIRPGNFVFYDLMQEQIKSCEREEIAIAVYCPVVDINRKRNEAIIYGGAVHFSKEAIYLSDGRKVFGEVAFTENEGWFFPEQRIFLKSLTQEHGIISVTEDMINNFRIGDIVAVIPVHACLAVDLLREYHTLTGIRIKDLCPK